MSSDTNELHTRYQSAMIHAILTTVVDMTIDDALVHATMNDVPVGTMIVEIKMIKIK